MFKILVVEDEPAIGEVCRRVLVGEGFDVDIAVNGNVAQDFLGKNNYALMLIDIRTPMMNGKELYQYIESKYPALASSVIFTTGDVMSIGTQQFLGQSGRLLLPKPFSTDQLKSVVKQALKNLEK